MPNSKNNRKEPEKNRRGRISEKASSFHGRIPTIAPAELRRPKTLPNLVSDRTVSISMDARPKLTKLLFNVTIQGSPGAVQVVISSENTVGELILAAVGQYSKEARRPILTSMDTSSFGLHYSQFSLESLEREQKLMALGSRNFFLCTKKAALKDGENGTTSCSKQAEKVTKSGTIPWLKFIDFMFYEKEATL